MAREKAIPRPPGPQARTAAAVAAFNQQQVEAQKERQSINPGVVFRQVDYPHRDPGIFWQAEIFADDPGERGFPIGTAYVTALPGGAQLNFVIVADHWRRRGYAKRLVEACRNRWPQLQITSGISPGGEALVRRFQPPNDEE